MDRLAVTAILVVLLGVWVHPFLAGATARTNSRLARGQQSSSTTEPNTELSSVSSDSSTITPATQPVTYKKLVGQPGFWRLGQTETGIWWFVSPTDQPEFMNTVTTVQPYQLGRDPVGPHYMSRDFHPKDKAKPDEADLEQWATATIDRLHAIGFKGIGAWSNPVFHKFDVPITRDLNVWSWMKPESRRFYSPGWATTADLAMQMQAGPLKDNRNLVGYFVDNEIDWGDAFVGPSIYFNELPQGDPNRVQVLNVVQSIWQTIDDFNRDWSTSFKDWDELAALPNCPRNNRRHTSDFSRLGCHMCLKTTSV